LGTLGPGDLLGQGDVRKNKKAEKNNTPNVGRSPARGGGRTGQASGGPGWGPPRDVLRMVKGTRDLAGRTGQFAFRSHEGDFRRNGPGVRGAGGVRGKGAGPTTNRGPQPFWRRMHGGMGGAGGGARSRRRAGAPTSSRESPGGRAKTLTRAERARGGGGEGVGKQIERHGFLGPGNTQIGGPGPRPGPNSAGIEGKTGPAWGRFPRQGGPGGGPGPGDPGRGGPRGAAQPRARVVSRGRSLAGRELLSPQQNPLW